MRVLRNRNCRKNREKPPSNQYSASLIFFSILISVKNEEYQTLGGAKGVKVFGNFEITNQVKQTTQKNEYVMLNFAEQGGFQQITVVYDIEDRYARDVAQRIINSVELRNPK